MESVPLAPLEKVVEFYEAAARLDAPLPRDRRGRQRPAVCPRRRRGGRVRSRRADAWACRPATCSAKAPASWCRRCWNCLGRGKFPMKLTLHRFDLHTRHPFTTSRGTSRGQPTVVVELEQDGSRGYGEAPQSSYYGAEAAAAGAALERARPRVEAARLVDPADLWEEFVPLLADTPFAQCALDVAAHDLWGKLRDAPVWKLWGLQIDRRRPATIPSASTPSRSWRQSSPKCPAFPSTRSSWACRQDLDVVQTLRRNSAAAFRVDVNGGWTAEQMIALAPELGGPGRRADRAAAAAGAVGAHAACAGPIGPAACGRRKLPQPVRRGPLGRVLPRRQYQAGQVRRTDAGTADDRPGQTTRLAGDDRLFHRVRRSTSRPPRNSCPWPTTPIWTGPCCWPTTSPAECASTAAGLSTLRLPAAAWSWRSRPVEGKGDDLADIRGPGGQHHQTIQSHRHADRRRQTGLHGRQKPARLRQAAACRPPDAGR